MEVILAKKAGACYGVNRSIEMVERAFSPDKKIATLGALIHNPRTVKELQNHGVSVVESVEEAADLNVDTIVIRSHGVPSSVITEAKNSKIDVVDATCPHVVLVQKKAAEFAKKYGAVIVIGKAGHPEVKGVCGYVLENGAICYVIESCEDVDEACSDLLEKACVGVVCQTTQSVSNFKRIVDYIKQRGINVDVENTICQSTAQRQSAADELSKCVDAFIVVGGKNSSNTTHLADVCRVNCKKTYHIETYEELNPVFFKGCKKVGITAGASTPQSQIEPVISFVSTL